MAKGHSNDDSLRPADANYSYLYCYSSAPIYGFRSLFAAPQIVAAFSVLSGRFLFFSFVGHVVVIRGMERSGMN